jgi:hypothetical protein
MDITNENTYWSFTAMRAKTAARRTAAAAAFFTLIIYDALAQSARAPSASSPSG